MKSVRVFAPATVANLAVGYDVLGLCLDQPGDEVVIKEGTSPGLKITTITGDKGLLPYEVESNTASHAALRLLEDLGLTTMPVEMEIHKKMGMGTGLGSSAASAVAGVYAMNAFLDEPMSKAALLRYAVEGEAQADGAYHADNVAPSLFGGIVLIRSNTQLDYIELPVPEKLVLAMIYPHIEILTSESRAILKATVELNQMVKQTGNIAAFTASLFNNDYNLMSRSLEDLVIEPQRAKLIPEFEQVKEIALHSGALGFSISGAGPSMFALCHDHDIAEKIAQMSKSHFDNKGIGADCFISKINTTGAIQID